MSFDFHHNKPEYFNQQYLNSRNYVLPFIEETLKIEPSMRILEIGCAEGGVLKAFTERGCVCTGVELSPSKIATAQDFMKDEIEVGLINFICKNIYDVDFKNEFENYFDLIILKDTIEHIHDQNKLISGLKDLLKQNGQIYFGFPPWCMPWGGHQQICKSKFLMMLPYFHLLPLSLYRLVLKIAGETPDKIESLAEIKETGISSRRFENIALENGYKILNKRFYIVNPIYLYKFKANPTRQLKLIERMPLLRDFISTTVYYSVG